MTSNDRFDVKGMGRNTPGGLTAIAGSGASAFITGADREISGGRR